jgi:hypothetical protein
LSGVVLGTSLLEPPVASTLEKAVPAQLRHRVYRRCLVSQKLERSTTVFS